jgi:hypothetical protein
MPISVRIIGFALVFLLMTAFCRQSDAIAVGNISSAAQNSAVTLAPPHEVHRKTA